MEQFVSLVTQVLDALQKVDPLVWAALAAYFAPYGQELLKRVRDLGEKSNYVVGLVVIPTVIALLTGVQSSDVLNGLHPLVASVLTATFAAVVSQLKYGLSLKPRLDEKKKVNRLESIIANENANNLAIFETPAVAPRPQLIHYPVAPSVEEAIEDEEETENANTIEVVPAPTISEY